MGIGYHITIGAYGFWLPNDPRGSWSTFVGSDALYDAAGPATKTSDPRSLANRPHDYQERQRAKSTLKQKPVRFTELQRDTIGRAFSSYFSKSICPVWACAILHKHIHLAIGLTPLPLDQFVNQLKGAATKQLVLEQCHPFQGQPDSRGRLPKCFLEKYWKKFLDDHADVERSIGYVEENPAKDGLAPQVWGFVTPYKPGPA